MLEFFNRRTNHSIKTSLFKTRLTNDFALFIEFYCSISNEPLWLAAVTPFFIHWEKQGDFSSCVIGLIKLVAFVAEASMWQPLVNCILYLVETIIGWQKIGLVYSAFPASLWTQSVKER